MQRQLADALAYNEELTQLLMECQQQNDSLKRNIAYPLSNDIQSSEQRI
jgi:hypothetical protein